MSVSQSVCLYVCLYVSLPVCLSICPSVCLFLIKRNFSPDAFETYRKGDYIECSYSHVRTLDYTFMKAHLHAIIIIIKLSIIIIISNYHAHTDTSASDWCALQEALYKCIDAIQYNTIQYNTIQYNTHAFTQTFTCIHT